MSSGVAVGRGVIPACHSLTFHHVASLFIQTMPNTFLGTADPRLRKGADGIKNLEENRA